MSDLKRWMMMPEFADRIRPKDTDTLVNREMIRQLCVDLIARGILDHDYALWLERTAIEGCNKMTIPKEHDSPEYQQVNWQAEFDSLLDMVVGLCEESRTIDTDPAQQGRWLRDRLLAACDPLFIVHQRLAKGRTC